ncbi:hypothetical protein ONS96_000144 [Cadophora gregata f. sp. sojae]|nr:hypothetical protein ONS96_000144 [Cadophora gregata f. sp. sojae]
MADVEEAMLYILAGRRIKSQMYIYSSKILQKRSSNIQTTQTNTKTASRKTKNTTKTHMFRSKSPAKSPSLRPTAQQNTKLLHALFLNEENKRDPYTRRPSSSTPSQSEGTSRRSSVQDKPELEKPTPQEKTEQISQSQNGNVHVVGKEEGGLRGRSG